MMLEVNEITIDINTNMYDAKSYPHPGLFRVFCNGSINLVYNSGSFVNYMMGGVEVDSMLKEHGVPDPITPPPTINLYDPKESAATAITKIGISEDFAIRMMETAIRETKKP